MGRHEIRLRRQKMTSRRIEGHKNYYDLLKKHERQGFGKRLLKVIIYIVVLLSLVLLAFYAVRKIDTANDKHEDNAQAELVLVVGEVIST